MQTKRNREKTETLNKTTSKPTNRNQLNTKTYTKEQDNTS